MTFLNFLASLLFEIFFCESKGVESCSADLTTFLFYGATCGILSMILGYMLSVLAKSLESKWIFLSFLIPIFSCLTAAIEVECVNIFETGTFSIVPVGDTAFALSLYASFGILSGLIAMSLIGAWKLLQKLWFESIPPGITY